MSYQYDTAFCSASEHELTLPLILYALHACRAFLGSSIDGKNAELWHVQACASWKEWIWAGAVV